MRKGISVWLDVPLEALARRIAEVGTHSRPLLHSESGDPYTKVCTVLVLKNVSVPVEDFLFCFIFIRIVSNLFFTWHII